MALDPGQGKDLFLQFIAFAVSVGKANDSAIKLKFTVVQHIALHSTIGNCDICTER
jgi:hypothetical protein